MPVWIKPRSLALLGTAVLFACVVLASPGQGAPAAQQGKPSKAELEAQKKALEAQKKALEAIQKQAAEAMKGKEVEVLTAAYILLCAANNDYDGHKKKAMQEVEATIKILDASILKNGSVQQKTQALQGLNKITFSKIQSRRSGAAHELQLISDAQVQQAELLLAQLAIVMAAHKQPAALKHVQHAVKELDAALVNVAKQHIKGAEADLLTVAYILLAAANHNYDGHRVKAMGQVEAGLNILDANILRHGTVEQKIKAVREEMIQALVEGAAKKDPKIHESQAVSDAQLLMAGALLQRAALVLSALNQPVVLKHTGNALSEIGISLRIR